MENCIKCGRDMVRKADDRGHKQFQCDNCGFTRLVEIRQITAKIER